MEQRVIRGKRRKMWSILWQSPQYFAADTCHAGSTKPPSVIVEKHKSRIKCQLNVGCTMDNTKSLQGTNSRAGDFLNEKQHGADQGFDGRVSFYCVSLRCLSLHPSYNQKQKRLHQDGIKLGILQILGNKLWVLVATLIANYVFSIKGNFEYDFARVN